MPEKLLVPIYRSEERHTYPEEQVGIHWSFEPIPSSVWCPVPGLSGAINEGAAEPYGTIVAPAGSRMGENRYGEKILVLPGEKSGLPAKEATDLAEERECGLSFRLAKESEPV